MSNGWTGGQYSLVRALLGLYLVLHFAALLPYAGEVFSSAGVLPEAALSPYAFLFPNVLAWWDAPAAVIALLLLGSLAGLLLAVGWHDRVAAIGAWYVLACLFGRNPLIANPSLPYLGWMLLAHACLAPAPYGSLAAVGRQDPRGGWSFSRPVFALAWIALALGYTYSGLTKLASPSWLDGSAMARVLENPLARPGFPGSLLLALPEGLLAAATWGALGAELIFTPLALFARTRPLAWAVLLAMHLGLVVLIDFAELSSAMVLFHLFTFDPAWIPARGGGALRLYYDGSCGLCQRWVRFVLAEDRVGLTRFSPLGGETFQRELGLERAAGLPDSVVVATPEGTLLARSDAIVRLLASLGGAWRIAGLAVSLVPRALRDGAYDGVARVRRRLFAAPKSACPLGPREITRRFDA